VAGMRITPAATCPCARQPCRTTNTAASWLAFILILTITKDGQLTLLARSNIWPSPEFRPRPASIHWNAIFTNISPTGINKSILQAGAAAPSSLFYRIKNRSYL